jgi:serine/threonine protein kinase
MGVDHFLNLQPGTIVNERYEIVRCLGAGSMGMVYACRHKELAGHIVAMKVLYSEVARDEIAATRFKNEIFASYNVSHPSVVRAYEYFTDGELTAFTMEFIGGGDLADRLETAVPIEISDIVSMLAQMASGLEAIHEAGIIHRDIKPENILITAQGDVKITDFGIARKVSGPRLTEHGGVVGTIDYVSPEYLELNQVDERSDLYSLGILAYEMITLESPFQGKSIIDTMQLRLKQSARPPIELREDCPQKLNDIVLKMMARQPDDRYQSASILYKELRQLYAELNPDSAPAPEQLIDESALFQKKPSDEVLQATPALPVAEKPLEQGFKPVTVTPTPQEAKGVLSSALKQPAEDADSESKKGFSSFKDFVQTAESKLAATQKDHFGGPKENDSKASISVASAGVDSDRLRQFAASKYRSSGITLKSIVLWLVVCFIWLGLVFSVLRYYRPDLFEGGGRNRGVQSGSVQSGSVQSGSVQLTE